MYRCIGIGQIDGDTWIKGIQRGKCPILATIRKSHYEKLIIFWSLNSQVYPDSNITPMNLVTFWATRLKVILKWCTQTLLSWKSEEEERNKRANDKALHWYWGPFGSSLYHSKLERFLASLDGINYFVSRFPDQHLLFCTVYFCDDTDLKAIFPLNCLFYYRWVAPLWWVQWRI